MQTRRFPLNKSAIDNNKNTQAQHSCDFPVLAEVVSEPGDGRVQFLEERGVVHQESSPVLVHTQHLVAMLCVT